MQIHLNLLPFHRPEWFELWFHELSFTGYEYRFPITVKNFQRGWFEISYRDFANIEFYEFEKGIRINSITTGIKTPFATRPYKNRNFVFPISIAPNTEKVILIRVQSRLLQIPKAMDS